MIRMILSDLDGTLLYPERKLPEGTFELITALHEKGIVFAAASGRQYDNLRRLFWPVREKMAFICENGTLTVAGGRTIDCSRFPEDMARQVMRDIRANGMELLVSLPECSILAADGDRDYSDRIIYGLKNTAFIADDPEQFAGECIKISGYAPEGVGRAAGVLQKKWGERMHADIAGPCWLDFTLQNKGDGMRALESYYGIAAADTAAFGDQQNDMSMLCRAGHAYLMENGDTALLGEGMQLCRAVLPQIRELTGL